MLNTFLQSIIINMISKPNLQRQVHTLQLSWKYTLEASLCQFCQEPNYHFCLYWRAIKLSWQPKYFWNTDCKTRSAHFFSTAAFNINNCYIQTASRDDDRKWLSYTPAVHKPPVISDFTTAHMALLRVDYGVYRMSWDHIMLTYTHHRLKNNKLKW